MTIDMHSDFEPDDQLSATGHLLDELSLYGYRPFSDEADPRPLPEDHLVSGDVHLLSQVRHFGDVIGLHPLKEGMIPQHFNQL